MEGRITTPPTTSGRTGMEIDLRKEARSHLQEHNTDQSLAHMSKLEVAQQGRHAKAVNDSPNQTTSGKYTMKQHMCT
jgi:hypothetical protein